MLAIEAENRILKTIFSKAIVTNSNGDLNIDGTLASKFEITRSLKILREGIEDDIKEMGPNNTENYYSEIATKPGYVGHIFQSAINLTRFLDQEDLKGKK